MTTIADIYTEAVQRDQSWRHNPFDLLADYGLKGTYFDHMPEWRCGSYEGMPDGNERVQLRVARYLTHDARRFWRTAAVFLDGEPFMVVQNAGREGDDFHRRFVTSRSRYVQAVRYLNGLGGVADADGLEAVDPSYSDPELDYFYGDRPL